MSDDDEKPDAPGRLTRRDWISLSTGGALLAAAAVAARASRSATTSPPTASAAGAGVIRVASVPTAVEGNLLPTLLGAFQQDSPYEVELSSHEDVYELARTGHVDLAISHYGHRGAEGFVMGGLGEWPRTLFSNQMALLGPAADPAKIRGLEDAGDAFRRIAAAKAPFVVNHIDGVRYLTEVLWHSAGRPDRGGWYFDEGMRKGDAVRHAAERGAYTFWGLTPFLRLQSEGRVDLEPLVLNDPLLQRMLVSIVVKPAPGIAVNDAGARALQSYLLSPATQARIREVRYPGTEAAQWVPGGRHNRTAILPLT